MTTRWDRINAIFHRAIELPQNERAAYLEEACGGDAGLRAEISRLLDADAHASGFIEKASDHALEALARTRGFEGRQIGAWRILREIGRGGMGAVWLGERADKQFEQQVAIKLIHPGMDADWVLRRFRTERRILAGLDHPHIARLFDGGTTEEGIPYFVMEHIEGVPIDRYCDERRLSITQRLELFRQVCSAVSFAHQSLVIHRDIKPSNVLVSKDGTAKLLDFGIATILQDRGTGAELHTATVQQLMTPEYASPEQVEGRGATTLSDVYALGVMLYELLCGRAPYRFANRSLTEVARVLGETKPERPSAALTEEISAAREGTVERLRRRLRGDLDTIVLKAMHADPQRRYASAEQLSEDIRRHLAGLPVIARPDTIAYRTRKFVRRNRVAVGAGMIVALALVGGAVATTWQALRAREAQARAERRFGDLRKLAHAVLFDYHDAVKDLAGSTPVRERLVEDGLAYLDGLAREAGDDVSLQGELAAAYRRMGDVQGGVGANLGNTEGALQSYRKSEAIYEALIASDSTSADNWRGLASTLVMHSRVLWQTIGPEEAVEKATRARMALEPLVAEGPTDVALRRELVIALDSEAMLVHETGDVPRALELHKNQLEQCDAMVASDPADPAARRLRSSANGRVSKALTALADYETALEYNRASLEERAALVEEFPTNAEYQRSLTVAYFYNGELLSTLGRTREALESYEKNLAILDKLAAADPQNEQYRSDRGHTMSAMGDTYLLLDDIDGAVARYRGALAIRSAELGVDSSNVSKRIPVISSHAKLATALARKREPGPASTHSSAALALVEAMNVDPTNAGLRAAVAEIYADLGNVHAIIAEATPSGATKGSEWQRALDMYRRSAAIWLDLRERRLLAESDVAQLDAVNREIARCTSAAAS